MSCTFRDRTLVNSCCLFRNIFPSSTQCWDFGGRVEITFWPTNQKRQEAKVSLPPSFLCSIVSAKRRRKLNRGFPSHLRLYNNRISTQHISFLFESKIRGGKGLDPPKWLIEKQKDISPVSHIFLSLFFGGGYYCAEERKYGKEAEGGDLKNGFFLFSFSICVSDF